MKERMRVLSYRILVYQEAISEAQSNIALFYFAECMLQDARELAYLVSCDNVVQLNQLKAA